MQQILAAIIEDFPDWREKIINHLESNGIHVVAKAATKVQGIQLIAQLEKLHIDVLILDGALDQSANDGNEIGKLCKEIAPNVLRVGMSRYLDGVTEVDIVVGKVNIEELAETIFSCLS